MGPVLVATMTHGGVGEPPSKKVHPFFAKGATPTQAPPPDAPILPQQTFQNASPSEGTQPIQTIPPQAPIAIPDADDFKSNTNLGQSPATATAKAPTNTEKSAFDILSRAPMPATSTPSAPVSNPPVTTHHGDTAASSTFPVDPMMIDPMLSEPRPIVHTDADPSKPESEHAVPKKILKFNLKTGTLGSPPKSKTNPRPSRLVCIRYAKDDATRLRIGEKITAIMDGSLHIPESPKRKVGRPKGSTRRNEAASKASHPLFGTKQAAKPPPVSTPPPSRPPKQRHTMFSSTPVSPRKHRDPITLNKPAPFASKPTGVKIPGALHPLWPPQGMSHIRQDQSLDGSRDMDIPFRCRKSKGTTVYVANHESVLNAANAALNFDAIRNTLPKDDYTFPLPPKELRLPTRHFESGRKLRNRIKRELASRVSSLQPVEQDMNADELAREENDPIHPAVAFHWHALESKLSAYDRSTCETSSWNHKYAPVSAAQVIQPGKETALMKSWLQQLRVQSVESGSSAVSKAKADTGHKKKRRKTKLDGFVVDSDEEGTDTDGFSEIDDGNSASLDSRVKRTVVKSSGSSRNKGRLANAIVVSGPSGCGKSAAVYAVAKELDFEVFEISSSSRRSGKDVLEKVGDMTRNHLVQQHRAEASNPTTDEETIDDIKTGKQGMMTSFFKPKPGEPKKKPIPSVTHAKSKGPQPKAQKQSLILLEEVDVLFEEDKQFWTSLTQLMAQSKRPFIMTCNDESLLPVATLNLHGIFRLQPPPATLAADVCLLIAANEGHALKRRAVEALYRSRRYDLRATIAELNYWCQLGVGDRRGGFDWFYSRWPRGTDLDENRDVVRVVSEDTYLKGMGWLCRDTIFSPIDLLETEQECADQSWYHWTEDICRLQAAQELPTWAEQGQRQNGDAAARLASASAFDGFCSSVSDADICSKGAFAEGSDMSIDATLPELSSSARNDYIIGQTLLEAETVDYSFCNTKAMSSAIKLLARQVLQTACPADTQGESAILQPLGEDKSVMLLDKHFATPKPQQLTRYDLAVAFDPIAVAPKAIPSSHLDPSVFDRTLKLIVLEVAPMVRSIVSSEGQLMQDRIRLSNLLDDGSKKKRMRTTRSALSALEGGERKSTRRERYFGESLEARDVMRTAGQYWQAAVSTPEVMDDVDDLQALNSPVSMQSTEMIQ